MSGHNSNGRGYNRSAPYHRKQQQGNFNHNNNRQRNRDNSEWNRQHTGNSYSQPQAPSKQNNPPVPSYPNLVPTNPGHQNSNAHKAPGGYYGPPSYNYPIGQTYPFPPPIMPPQALMQMHQQFFPGAPLQPMPPQPPGLPQNAPPHLGYYAHGYLAQNCYPHYPPQQPWLGGYMHPQPYPQMPMPNYQPPMANAYLPPPAIRPSAPDTRPEKNHYRNNSHSATTLKPTAPATPPKNRLSYSPQLPAAPEPHEKPHAPLPKAHVFPIEPTPKDLPSPPKAEPTELYEKIAQIGEGTYGKVYKARNLQTQAFVALKCLRLEKEREGFPLTALREIKLLQKLRDKRIVQLLEILTIDKSIYMVFEYMDYDLSGFLSHPASVIRPDHILHLMRQLLLGLDYLHSNGIVHRDLKGSNLLLDKKGNLKIADFGLARILDQRRNRDYTNRVITLWYRPPELLLGATNYGNEVDLWGAGCIMLEMFLRTPAFPGKDEIDQLDLVYRCLGTPSTAAWPGIQDLPWYQLLLPVEHHPPSLRSTYSSSVPALALDLAEMMLAMCPQNRISAREALRHPYFCQDEPRPNDFPTLEGDWHEYEVKILQRKKQPQSPS